MQDVQCGTAVLATTQSNRNGFVSFDAVMFSDGKFDLTFDIIDEMFPAQVHTRIFLIDNGVLIAFVTFERHRFCPCNGILI